MDIKPTGSFAQSGSAYINNSLPNMATQAVKQAPASPSPAVQATDPAASKEQLSKALEDINKTMENLSTGLEFSVDGESNRTVVKVVDRQTQEVIRQMPTKEALEIAKAIDKLQGLLIHHKA